MGRSRMSKGGGGGGEGGSEGGFMKGGLEAVGGDVEV